MPALLSRISTKNPRMKTGIMSMIPNLLPVVFIFGTLGWLGVKVDIGIMMTASVALGVAVDDTIHFFHNFRRYFDETGDVEVAVALLEHAPGAVGGQLGDLGKLVGNTLEKDAGGFAAGGEDDGSDGQVPFAGLLVVVDGLGHVMDAVLERVERGVLGVLDRVASIVEEVVHVARDVLQRVLDLAVLARGFVGGRVDGTGEALLDGRQISLGRVDRAVRGVGQ